MGIKGVILILLGLSFAGRSAAQTTTGAVYDSTYHNYLYDQRTAYFEGLPKIKGGIIFLGNSITHWGDWAELLQDARVKNRGIAGDISFGILARINEMIKEKPDKIFIMIGVNDIGRNIPLSVTIKNYNKIISTLQSELPETELFVQSVLPINETLINRKYYTGTNSEIKIMNEALKKLASSFNITYIDLYNVLADKNGGMPSKYTYDGIHLTSEAYIVWTNLLKEKRYCCK